MQPHLGCWLPLAASFLLWSLPTPPSIFHQTFYSKPSWHIAVKRQPGIWDEQMVVLGFPPKMGLEEKEALGILEQGTQQAGDVLQRRQLSRQGPRSPTPYTDPGKTPTFITQPRFSFCTARGSSR